jgi:hypothetical protein
VHAYRKDTSVSVSDWTPVTIRAFDVAGRLVDAVFTGTLAPGRRTLSWAVPDAAAPSASYYLLLESPSGAARTSFVFLR